MPATSDSTGGPAQGARPPGNPKGVVECQKSQKAQECYAFLNAFRPSPFDPSEPKFWLA